MTCEHTIKALTVRQPWASLIALGVKTIETRSWSTPHRGPLAIHAGAHIQGRRGERRTFGDYEVERDASGYLLRGRAWPYRLPLGSVVAVVNLADCLPMTTHADPGDPDCIVVHDDDALDLVLNPDDLGYPSAREHLIRDISPELPLGYFAPGRFGSLLDDVKPIEPVPAKGRLGLWDWTPPGCDCDVEAGNA